MTIPLFVGNVAVFAVVLALALGGGISAPLLLRRFHRSGWWLLCATGVLVAVLAVFVTTARSTALNGETSPQGIWELLSIFVMVAWFVGVACGGLVAGYWAILHADES